MGLAEVDTSVKNYETWIEYADSALYDSKESGRNKISLHAKKS
jgi:PleD family two-component response regulator